MRPCGGKKKRRGGGGSLTGKIRNVFGKDAGDTSDEQLKEILGNKQREVAVAEKMTQEVPSEWFELCDQHSKVFHQVTFFFPNPEEVMAREM
jgi:hypothetical protein